MDFLKVVSYLILVYFGFNIGRHIGYRDGVDSIEFDRSNANMRLQQCLRIVRGE
jgi:hypothetical protein